MKITAAALLGTMLSAPVQAGVVDWTFFETTCTPACSPAEPTDLLDFKIDGDCASADVALGDLADPPFANFSAAPFALELPGGGRFFNITLPYYIGLTGIAGILEWPQQTFDLKWIFGSWDDWLSMTADTGWISLGLGGCPVSSCQISGFWQDTTPVSEPTSLALLLVALAAAYRRHRSTG